MTQSSTTKRKTKETVKEWSDKTIAVKKFGMDQTTKDGSYWVEVCGQKIGEDGRTHWTTPRMAWLCGYRYWMRVTNAKH